MTTYKLQITYVLDTDGEPSEAIKEALNILKVSGLATTAQVALNRDGDRSNANLLAPVSKTHYKHGKVSLEEALDYRPFV